jgi:hypothetical protein
MPQSAKRIVGSYHAVCPDLEAATKAATAYANLFDEVISVQIIFNADGGCKCGKSTNKSWQYYYAVFGYFSDGLPRRVTTDGSRVLEESLMDDDFICERPMPDGTLLMYRRTSTDIRALIAHLADVGVSIPEALTVGFWKTREACTGSKLCSTKTCTTGSCTSCSLGSGSYCCC